ncbi:hypothetical protein QAD02_002681 [Eretmocerus hayati]|uniref:Uncharacterized protein n=1 Tax=Eretmocerus hayati TaxID=131215 RepID=A0ACC2NK06_9HYME|nr:hypothetical protein QAD02_002681 [Eretmocerus hayati]
MNYLNRRMHPLNFGYGSSDVRPKINLEYVKRNNRFRMSSPEMLFFVRYFSTLVGEMVLPDDKTRTLMDEKVWNLYLKLREIVHLLTSVFVTESMLAPLDTVITEHHFLYIELFGYLKAKFHLLPHYVRIIRRTGPVIKISSIRFEAYHQLITKCISYSNYHKNILKTIGMRLQSSFMVLNSTKYEEVFKTCGMEIQSELANALFYDTLRRRELKSVTLNGITYSENSIIVVDFNEDGIVFGLVKNIFEVDEKSSSDTWYSNRVVSIVIFLPIESPLSMNVLAPSLLRTYLHI